MKERPILFSSTMVRAILAGTKTQTRRVCKPAQAEALCEIVGPFDDETGAGWFGDAEGDVKFSCPYGQPGDRLWVRESGWERPERTAKMMREGADTWPRFAYAADDWNDQDRADFKEWGFKPRPSIHMPRWASRIMLEIVSVRVERLQDISVQDAIAEGCASRARDPVVDYLRLWESLNGPGSWAANPWVWVVEFKRVTP